MKMSFFNSIKDKIKKNIPAKQDDLNIDNMLKNDPASLNARSASVLEASQPVDPLINTGNTQPAAEQTQTTPLPVEQQNPQTQGSPAGASVSDMLTQASANNPQQPLSQEQPLQQNHEVPPNPIQALQQSTTNITPAGSTGLDIHNIKSTINKPQLEFPQATGTVHNKQQSHEKTEDTFKDPTNDIHTIKTDIIQIKEKLNLIIEKLNVVEERTAKY